MCSSVTQVLVDKKVDFTFYHINDDLLPDESDLLSKIENKRIVLLISYFGLVSVRNITEKIKSQNPECIVIVDDVQNFYSTEYKDFANYRFTSYRKWFAVPDGAEVYSRNGKITLNDAKNTFAQYKFAGNLLKNFEGWVDDDVCLDLLKKGENILDTDYNCKCSDISNALIHRIEYEVIKQKRRENARYLHNALSNLGIRHSYKEDAVPLFIPIFLENRDEIRAKMFENNVFTPVHWPYESETLNGIEKNMLYDTELSLICDQRYSQEDMERQIDILSKFM